MDEINFLVWRYMQENGFPHSAYVFETESHADASNITSAQIPPGALITLLQKSIVYLNLEKSIRLAKHDPNSSVAAEIERINMAFPRNQEKTDETDEKAVLPFSDCNPSFIKEANAPIENFSWSPDAKKIAALAADNVCTVYFVNEGLKFERLVLTQIPQSSSPRCPAEMSWNATSELIAIATDSQAMVFNMHGKIAFTIAGGVSAVKFGVSPYMLVTCSRMDYSVNLWEIRDGQPSQLESFPGLHGLVYDLDWRDEGLFAAACHDKSISLYAVSGNKQMLYGHLSPATFVAFSCNKALLASGSDDGSVRIWKEGRILNVLKGHSNGISGIKWSPIVPNTIYSSSLDGTVKYWDALSGECLQTFAHHMNGIISIDIHPSGQLLVTGGQDGIIAIWKIPDAKLINAYTYKSKISHLTFSPSGEYIAVSFESSNMAIIQSSQYLT